MKQFPQRKIIRHQNHDYASPGMYFVTICTKNREPLFGHIHKGIMCLNNLGNHVRYCRNRIPFHHPHIHIDEFICMPDHIHGIIIIPGRRDRLHLSVNEMEVSVNQQKVPLNEPPVSTVEGHVSSFESHVSSFESKGQIGSDPTAVPTLSSVIRGFKTGVTQYTLQHDISFARQPGFHDRIIRSEHQYHNIKDYIRQNPSKG